MSFTVATYNVLANAYIQHTWYRRTPKLVLDPVWRVPALVQYVAALATDVVCLQEVEIDVFVALNTRLNAAGYLGQYARKRGDQPDGCATFYRQHAFELIGTRVVEYADGSRWKSNSGHIALIVLLRTAGRVLGIANTHLTWDSPGTPGAARLGYRQAQQLLNECQTMAPTCDGWLICGDLNVTPDSEVVAIFERAGLQYAHAGLAQTYTCKVNTEIKMIDYLFYSPQLRAEPRDVEISDQTVLPSAEQPSDHLPIIARFSWKT
ncbi:MAG: endonuclease/exonuclease/phosphatase family protein [Candidatus Binatia bacterium]